MKLVFEEKIRKATQEEIDAFIEYRANHVALVQKLGEVAFGIDLSHHDIDKINAVGKELEMFAIRGAYNSGKIKLNKEDKNEIRKVSARHVKSQKHHPEYWDDSITIRNCKEDESIVHASRMPKRYILEMACDWSACALKGNKGLFDWYNKVIDETLFLTDNQKIELISALFRIKDVVEKYDIHYPNVEYTAESHFLEGKNLDKIGLFAMNMGYDVRTFVDWMKNKIENDWGQVIKTDKSDETHAEVNVSPKDAEKDAIERDMKELSDNLSNDPSVEEWSQDPSDKRKFEVEVDDEDKGFDFNISLTIKPSVLTGKCEEWTPTQECIWAWFLCKKVNGQEVPQDIEGVREVDWKKEIGIDVPFEIPEVWMQSFTEGSDALLPYLDSSKKYIGFREQSVINTLNLMDYPFLHDFINAIPRKRTDFGLPQDRNLWNPSDIYLIDVTKAMSLRRVFQDMATPNSKNFPTLDDVNAWFAQGLKDKTVVGISLKTYGVGDTGYANMGEDNRKTYTKVNGEVPVVLPSLSFDKYGRLTEAKIIMGSKEEGRAISFCLANGGVYTVREGANSKEGMCNKQIVNGLFQEMGVTVPRVNSHEGLNETLDKITTGTFTFYFGGKKCNSRLEMKNALKGYFQDLDYEYGKNKDKRYYDSVNYWAYALAFILLLQRAIESKKFGYTINTVRHGCKKLGKTNAPFVWIG